MLSFTIITDTALLIGLKYVIKTREELDLVVPIGISFYTLSIIGYVIDVYREKYETEKNFPLFLLYVTYFPHILQGPIARYDNLREQFAQKTNPDYEQITHGMQLLLWGYIKKLVIADRAAIFVDMVYANYRTQSGTVLFLASIFYSIQIYTDFSGCVDIALGASEMFGIRLMPNFRQPYLSDSINDFWKRWHISLSSWFRDYLYIPLGGNRKGNARRWINVLIVFTISGFWHGVGIAFVVWGLLHGIYQIIGETLNPTRKKLISVLQIDETGKKYHCLRVIITFLLVNYAWIFFRLADIKDALYIVKECITDISPWVFTDGTLNNLGIDSHQWHILLLFIVIAVIVDLLHEQGIRIRNMISKQHLILRWFIYLSALFSIILWGTYGIGYDAASFIYMNF